jgi:hypothetical protein
MTIVVIPSEIDVPLINEVEGTPAEIAERAKAFFKTAEFLDDADAVIVVDKKARDESRAMFTGSENAPAVPSTSGVALHLKALITEYDHQILDSNIQARNYLVNRLLEISDPKGPAKIAEQLRALELMGKVSEIALFTERVEVTINNKSTEELELELVNTLSKYMGNAVVVDSKEDAVLGIDLDEELGRVPKMEQNSAQIQQSE